MMWTGTVCMSMLVIYGAVTHGSNLLKHSMWKRRDVNECIQGLHNCVGLAMCVNTPGSFRCTCPKGYALAVNKFSCVDINECALGTDNCNGLAYCSNTNGSFICTCKAGYERSGTVCKDIDECKRGLDKCDSRATCTNAPGYYSCACLKGFKGDGYNCKDMKGCPLGCGRYADCVTTRDVQLGCVCRAGFYGRGRFCYDMNECKLGLHACHRTHAECLNTFGSFKCRCKKGFNGDGYTCTDVNECIQGLHNCVGLALCVNTPGSFRCTCPKGYEFNVNKYSCVDINECALGTDNCNGLAYCSNTNGSFICTCKAGYERSGTVCKDIDECKRGLDKCDSRATCTNAPGYYTCACRKGFKGDGYNCKDIKGCPLGCGRYADCVMTRDVQLGCVCRAGFYGGGRFCYDMNECKRGLHSCHRIHAECLNTFGSFKCRCKKGFKGDGYTCTDIDECALGVDTCHSDAVCRNTIGSFTCTCKPGFTGTGKNCSDVDECATKTNNCDKTQGYSMCTNTVGSYSCQCNSGFEGNGFACTDIDECKENTHNCHRPHAMCENTIGSFICKCKSGYRGDGFKCSPLKHCLEGTDDCSKYAKCTDLFKGGDYKCDCYFGFFGGGKTCTGSRGKRFLVLFMKNIMDPTQTSPGPKHAQIYIASIDKTDLKVTTSASLSSKLKTKIDRRESMKSNSEKILTIHFEIRTNDFQVENKGIIVETSKTTSVFALNHDGYTSDSTLILPTDRLGTRYIVPTTVPYDSRHSDYNSQIAFAAVQDRTRVTVVLKLPIGQSISYLGKWYTDGDRIVVNLNKYQTFQLSHNGDLTGTRISSSKIVAVFSGNRCNKLNRFGYCSHLVEQIPPVESLDTTYVVPPHMERSGTHVKVVAAHTGSTTFSYSVDTSKNTKTIGTYGNFDKIVTGKQAVVIEAKRQVLVLSFGLGAFRSRNGDPYMTMVPGVNQYVHQYQIAVPDGFDKNYISIIVKKSSKKNLRVDNAIISSSDVVSESSVRVGGTEYIAMAVSTTKGVHRVETTDKSRFGLMVYGHSRDDGYGFAANILGPGKI